MPSGRSHDAITFLLAAPAAGLAYAMSADDLAIAAVAGFAFVFAGVMFGPDLDTKSKQYARWGPFRLLWLPYRVVFKHRSRWSHGLIFGTLFRVVYFLGAATIAAFLIATLLNLGLGDRAPEVLDFVKGWESIGEAFKSGNATWLFGAVLGGMWAGAASHTLTDIVITYIKTGRVDALF